MNSSKEPKINPMDESGDDIVDGLWIACMMGRFRTVKMILGINPHEYNVDAALKEAKRREYIDIIEILENYINNQINNSAKSARMKK